MKIDGNYAVYKGNEYETLQMSTKDIVLYSRDKRDLDNGFSYYIDVLGVKQYDAFSKRVKWEDLEKAYKISHYATYKGEKLQVLNVMDDIVLLWSRDQSFAEKHGFEFDEPFSYIKEVKASEIEKLVETKTILPEFPQFNDSEKEISIDGFIELNR